MKICEIDFHDAVETSPQKHVKNPRSFKAFGFRKNVSSEIILLIR